VYDDEATCEEVLVELCQISYENF